MKSIGLTVVTVFCCMVSGPLSAQSATPTNLGQIVTVHDTSANPFLLPLSGTEVGDPFPVYWDGVWHLYALRGDLRTVLHFTSTDLVKWTEHEPAMVGNGIATGTVVRHDNKFYMFYTDAGPWKLRGQYHSKFLTAASRLATDGERRLCWGFFSKHKTPERNNGGYGGPLGVGRELVFKDDGSIGVRPLHELVAAIRKPQDNVSLFNCAREISGRWEIDAGEQVFRCKDEGGGALLLDLPEKNPDYFFEADMLFTSPQAKADVVVRTSENIDSGYRIAIEPGKKNTAIRQFKPGGGTFNEKDYAFAKGKPVKLQVFVCGNQIEAFVDGQVSASTHVLDRSGHRAAIEIAGGRATISRPLLHYFKYKEGK